MHAVGPIGTRVWRKLKLAMGSGLPACICAVHPASIPALHGNRTDYPRAVRIDYAGRLDHLVSRTADGGFELHLDDSGRNLIGLAPIAVNARAIT